jgi:hypothetical protein
MYHNTSSVTEMLEQLKWEPLETRRARDRYSLQIDFVGVFIQIQIQIHSFAILAFLKGGSLMSRAFDKMPMYSLLIGPSL